MAGRSSLSKGRFGRRFAVVLAGCSAIAGLLVTTAEPAGAKVVKPKITGLAASPSSVSNNDGTVTVTADVANASSCTLSSNLPVQELPITTSCTSGAFSQSVILPLNSGTKAKKYELASRATGAVSKSKKVKVSVAAGAGRPSLSGVVSVLGSNESSHQGLETYCAVLNPGGVDCWGDNTYGELGIGTATGPDTCGGLNCSKTAQQVLGVGGSGVLSGVKSLATAGNSTSFCALLQDGDVDCWGSNYLGALGIGTDTGPSQCNDDETACSMVPEQVPLTNVVSLTGGNYDFCAVLQGGGVDCWGYGAVGERGDGPAYESTVPNYNIDSPDAVITPSDSPLAGVTNVVWTNLSSFCALLSSGGVDCWGTSADGILGNGTEDGPDDCGGGHSCSMYARPVLGLGGSGDLSGATKIAAGTTHFCALLSTGGVDCWGRADEGQLGDDDSTDDATSPVVVDGVGGSGTLTSATDLVALSSNATGLSADVTCALIDSGSVDCWGSGDQGQLGNATSSDWSSVPVTVLDTAGTAPLSGVSGLFGNFNVFCASLTTGGLECWGPDRRRSTGSRVEPGVRYWRWWLHDTGQRARRRRKRPALGCAKHGREHRFILRCVDGQLEGRLLGP